MISYLFQTIFISIILIILLHNLYNFFKDKLTVPKTKDLVNNKQYQEIIDILNSDTSNNLHENVPVKENEIVTYRKWWKKGDPNSGNTVRLNGGWYKFKAGSLQYVWDKFNSNIDKWQNYYYNNSIVHYQYYGEQNFVHDTVVENGGKIITMPEKWYAKKNIHEDTKIIHHAGVDK